MQEYVQPDGAVGDDWVEDMRGKDILENLADDLDLSDDLKAMLGDNTKLGRLKFLFRHGLTDDDKIQTLIAMGGRSVSIFELTPDYKV